MTPREVTRGGGSSYYSDGIYSLSTSRHSHVSYYGFMFNIRAKAYPIVITGLRLGSTSPKGPFTYRIYTCPQPWRGVAESPEHWIQIGEGPAQLPWRVGEYAPVPLAAGGVGVPAGATQALYIHCPECAEAVAYRDDCDVPEDGVTDEDELIEITTGVASFNLVPFRDMYDMPRALAGVVEYRLAGG